MAVIDEIYEALSDDQALAALPDRIAAEAGARSCTLMTYAPDGALQGITCNHFTTEMLDYYFATEMYWHDPWDPPARRPQALNRATAMDEAVTPQVYLKSEFYNRFIREFGDDTFHCVGSIMTFAGGSGGLGVHRPMGERAFDARDAARVQVLVPHLRRLLEARSKLSSAERRAVLAEDALDAQRQAVFVTDGLGRPLQMNRRAEALARAGDGILLTRLGLRATDPAADSRLAEAVAAAAGGLRGRGAAFGLPRRSGSQPLRALVAPWTIGGRTRALVLVDDPVERDEDVAAKLSGIYGLTAAEAATVAALLGGGAPQDVAEQRGVSLPTVRSQIQQALAKTGARGIPELVELAATLPRTARQRR